MITVLQERPERLPMATACNAPGLNRSIMYQWSKAAAPDAESLWSRKEAPQPRALFQAELDKMWEVLLSEECRDQPPHEVYYALLEQGSISARSARCIGCCAQAAPGSGANDGLRSITPSRPAAQELQIKYKLTSDSVSETGWRVPTHEPLR